MKKVSRNFLKKNIFFIFIFTFTIPLFAHEFWLQPDKFIYKLGDNINVRFLVGENFEGENWSGTNKKISSLKLYFPGTVDDLSSQISDQKGDSRQS